MPAAPTDPADPRTWWVLLVEAVAGLQRGDKEPASAYLRFVQQHRGREQALAAKAALLEKRDHPAWRDCYRWAANGCRPPDAKRK